MSTTGVTMDLAAMHARRRELSRDHIAGYGIEVGALHQPLWVADGARVTYVDRMSVDDLRKQYPELAGYDLTPVGRIDDGEKLETFPPGSVDFVIANHMLEHCENPIGTIRSHLSRIKDGGVLYYAVPDKRYTFDLRRPLTTWEHLVEDDASGPERSRRGHYQEYSQLVDNCEGPALEARMEALMGINYSIHFHVWDYFSFENFLVRVGERLGGAFEVAVLEQNQMEIIAVLRKRGGRGATMGAAGAAAGGSTGGGAGALHTRLGTRLAGLLRGK